MEWAQGDIEEALAQIWREILQRESVGRDANFFELGGNSLLALDALARINQQFGSELTVADAYMNPTVREVAQALSGGQTENNFVDLRQEAVLDERIRALPGPCHTPPESILLTGATGFVGRFLLAQLLRDTNATLYCLVRPGSARAALPRLNETLRKWGLWRDEFEHRIVAIAGDLRLPGLGVSASTYRELCQRIDSIYHCATSMNHLETYSMAKAANVDAIGELLQLATHTKPKLTNYISTLSVFSEFTTGTERAVDEATSIDEERHRSSHGYAASKWVGEKVFRMACERGIPCNVFRLGLIWADAREGRYDELQSGYRLLKSCLLAGLGIRDYRYDFPPTPVDYTARAVVFLSSQYSQGGGIFHITAGSAAVERVFERCNEILGAPLELVPFHDWVQQIKRLHREGRTLPIVPVIEYAFSMDEAAFVERQRRTRASVPRCDCTQTQRELQQAGIVVPGAVDDLLRVCLQGLVSHDPQLTGLAIGRAS